MTLTLPSSTCVPSVVVDSDADDLVYPRDPDCSRCGELRCNGSYSGGCRCARCRARHAQRVRLWRARRFALRVERSGRPYAPGVSEHGTRVAYSDWGCRCDECTTAHARRQLELRHRRVRRRAPETGPPEVTS